MAFAEICDIAVMMFGKQGRGREGGMAGIVVFVATFCGDKGGAGGDSEEKTIISQKKRDQWWKYGWIEMNFNGQEQEESADFGETTR